MSTILWWWSQSWEFLWGPMEWSAIAAAALLFTGGLVLGMWVERKDINWAAAYGRWVLQKLQEWLEHRPRGLLSLIFMITLINASAVLLIILAAYLPPLSILLIILAGINTGVMAQRAGGSRAWIALAMPHSWVELPAVIVASAAAIEVSATRLGLEWFDFLADIVWAKVFFLRAALPFLIGAALLEAGLMIRAGGNR